MTQQECESKLKVLIETMMEIYSAYAPDGQILCVCVHHDYYNAHNVYWDKDAKHPINITYIKEADKK